MMTLCTLSHPTKINICTHCISKQDRSAIAIHAISLLAQKTNSSQLAVSKQAVSMMSHSLGLNRCIHWPGNVSCVWPGVDILGSIFWYPLKIRIIPFGAATHFSVQKPFGSSKIGHRSERFCVFLPIFAGGKREGNEQKFGGEWDQAKQWSFCFEIKP